MSQQIFLGLLVLAVAALWWLKRPDIASAEAHRLVSSGAKLVDVRSPGEFAGGHLDGAVNIPVDQLGARLGALWAKDKPIIVYCASGARSAMAKRTLQGKGYASVRNLGPMSNW